MNQEIIELSDESFDGEVLDSKLPVLVDFRAAWCSSCKMIDPLLDEIAREYGGRLKVASVDVEKNERTTGRFGIRGLPALLLFKGGLVKENLLGLIQRDQLEEAVKRWL